MQLEKHYFFKLITVSTVVNYTSILPLRIGYNAHYARNGFMKAVETDSMCVICVIGPNASWDARLQVEVSAENFFIRFTKVVVLTFYVILIDTLKWTCIKCFSKSRFCV